MSTHIHDDLSTSTRLHQTRWCMQAPTETLQGSLQGSSTKYYDVEVNGKDEVVSLDHLKAAHLEPTSLPTNT